MASRPEQELPIDDLRAQLQGELITPADPSYDEARQVFFKGVDERPLAVAGRRRAGIDQLPPAPIDPCSWDLKAVANAEQRASRAAP